MQYLNAVEYAEAQRIKGGEYADEICEALAFQDSVELQDLRACSEMLSEAVEAELEEKGFRAQVEWVEGRLALLESIEENLKIAGLGKGEADEEVQRLIETLDL